MVGCLQNLKMRVPGKEGGSWAPKLAGAPGGRWQRLTLSSGLCSQPSARLPARSAAEVSLLEDAQGFLQGFDFLLAPGLPLLPGHAAVNAYGLELLELVH